jgi:uncharacterized membrane protein
LRSLGGNYSSAYSINDSGEIVGTAYINGVSYHATLFDSTGAGNNIDLATPGSSGATSINDSGQIVGYASPGFYRATLFDPTGGGDNIDLGTLGGNYSYVNSINDSGQIIGWAYAGSDTSSRRPTLFDSTGGGNNIDLNNLIDPALGWTLTDVYSINDNGWIVGEGFYIDGPSHAVLLIPEPATFLLLGLGGLLLRKRDRA